MYDTYVLDVVRKFNVSKEKTFKNLKRSEKVSKQGKPN